MLKSACPLDVKKASALFPLTCCQSEQDRQIWSRALESTKLQRTSYIKQVCSNLYCSLAFIHVCTACNLILKHWSPFEERNLYLEHREFSGWQTQAGLVRKYRFVFRCWSRSVMKNIPSGSVNFCLEAHCASKKNVCHFLRLNRTQELPAANRTFAIIRTWMVLLGIYTDVDCASNKKRILQ